MTDRDTNKRKKHVNLSLTVEAHSLLKAQAERRGTNVSRMVEIWSQTEEELNDLDRISRELVKGLDIKTLERLEAYCHEKHTSPAEAVKRWVWGAKVQDHTMKGQAGLSR